MFLFIFFPFVGFYLGMIYEQGITINTSIVSLPQKNIKILLSPTPIASISGTISSNSTLNWKTYTSSKYNLSFKYPSNWKSYTEGKITLVPLNKVQYLDYVSAPIQIEFQQNPNKLTLDKWQQEENAKLMGIPYNYYNSKSTQKTTINGYTAYINKKSEDCEPVFCYEEIIMDNENIFIFKNLDLSGTFPIGTASTGATWKQIYSEGDIQTNQQIFETLLSTLKFTR